MRSQLSLLPTVNTYTCRIDKGQSHATVHVYFVLVSQVPMTAYTSLLTTVAALASEYEEMWRWKPSLASKGGLSLVNWGQVY